MSRSSLGRWPLALAGVIASHAATARADIVSLRELEEDALSENRSLDVQAAEARAALARVDALRAEGLPHLALDIGATAQPGAVTSIACARDRDGLVNDRCFVPSTATELDGETFVPSGRFGATLRFDGILYDFGRTDARVRGGRANAEAEEAEVRAQRETIVRAVRGAYLEWLAAHARREFAERGLETARERARAMESALDAGARSAADRDAAALEVARMRLEVLRAQAAEAEARSLVDQASGSELEEDAEPDPALFDIGPPERGPREPSIVQSLRLRRDAANAASELYDLRYAPFLSGTAQVGLGLQVALGEGNPTWLPSYQLQLALTVPLWEPRTEGHVLLEARALADAFEAAAEDARSTADAAYRRARERYTRAQEEVALAEEVVSLAERAAASSEERWRIAGGTIDTVLAAHERVQRAREDLVRARVDRASAVLRMLPID
jgi:outer membrane protein TolC